MCSHLLCPVIKHLRDSFPHAQFGGDGDTPMRPRKVHQEMSFSAAGGGSSGPGCGNPRRSTHKNSTSSRLGTSAMQGHGRR
eukprot:7602729-Pyramimonas_sp.AAC.1